MFQFFSLFRDIEAVFGSNSSLFFDLEDVFVIVSATGSKIGRNKSRYNHKVPALSFFVLKLDWCLKFKINAKSGKTQSEEE